MYIRFWVFGEDGMSGLLTKSDDAVIVRQRETRALVVGSFTRRSSELTYSVLSSYYSSACTHSS